MLAGVAWEVKEGLATQALLPAAARKRQKIIIRSSGF
jgi:hypothetical protein